ncbi:hypothetical protein [Fusobacterium hwasookii]|jgi:hypothetical protein|uniref:hypothetical protein n=1 Tax=Fusobacterium hwasookii TaxID=1583098 RepID=UPI0028EEE635|nr:hypothetical protein [Fusobacterium hwasookii]
MKDYKEHVLSVNISNIDNNESRFSLSSKDYRKLKIFNKNTRKLKNLLTKTEKIGKEIGSKFYMKKSSHKFLKTVNISNGYLIDESSLEYCKPTNKVFPKKNEILIVKDGAGNGLGEVALYPYENNDNKDTISSGLIAISIEPEYRYYVLALLKSQHFKDFLDLNTPQSSTIRHSKKIALEYEIPFPCDQNNSIPKKVEKLVSIIVENIIDKEEQIRIKHNKINQYINEELFNNQNDNSYQYTYPKLNEITKILRLDSGIYSTEFKRIDFLINNYKNGYFKISKDDFKSGNTPTIRVFNPKNKKYKWVTPTLISDEGFYTPISTINMKNKQNISSDCILIINRTSRGKKGEFVGISCFYDVKKYGLGHHNQGLYKISNYNKLEKLFLVCLLNSDIYRKICGCMSIGSKMKELKISDFSEIKFLNFPEDIRKKIIKEYYNESNFTNCLSIQIDNYIEISKKHNKESGIFQNSYELVELKNKLEDIIDKIIYNEKIVVEDYL